MLVALTDFELCWLSRFGFLEVFHHSMIALTNFLTRFLHQWDNFFMISIARLFLHLDSFLARNIEDFTAQLFGLIGYPRAHYLCHRSGQPESTHSRLSEPILQLVDICLEDFRFILFKMLRHTIWDLDFLFLRFLFQLLYFGILCVDALTHFLISLFVDRLLILVNCLLLRRSVGKVVAEPYA